MEISNLSDTESKTLVARMPKQLSEDLNSIKKTQSETKDTLIEIKNNLQGNNSRVDEAENQINDLEHKEGKNNHLEQKVKKESPQNEDSVNNLWDNFKRSNICIIGLPEGEEKEQEIRNLFEKIMKDYFPDLMKEIDMQDQKAQNTKQDGCKETTPSDIIIKRPKFKDKDF